jgi:hypothetical protein
MDRPEMIRPLSSSTKTSMGLFGPPGAGKTRLIANGAGSRSLIMRPPTDHPNAVDTDPKPLEAVVHNWSETTEVVDWVVHDGGKELDWFWWDSLSLFQDHGVDDVFEFAVAQSRNPHRALYGPDKGEYGINMDRIKKHMRDLVACSHVNVGFTAHPIILPNPSFDPEDENSPAELIQPWIQGKQMIPTVCGYMNVVLYLFEGSAGERILTSRSSGRYFVKDQLNAMPKGRLVNPTWADVDKLYGAQRRPARRTIKPRKGIA